jgi:Ca2+-binding EF-hand superfamily protein
LSLVSGLGTSEDELKALQREFIRLDVDKDGKIGKDELSKMTDGKLSK